MNAKELAEILNLSEAAVSFALNGRPGVSTNTRKRVLEAAKKYKYDFSRINQNKKKYGAVYYMMYKKYGSVVTSSEFFDSVEKYLRESCENAGYRFVLKQLMYGDDILSQIEHAIGKDCVGIVLLGTEMYREDFFPFVYIEHPIVLLDTYFYSTKMDCVLINNAEGAYQATRYLIQKRQQMPGYLHSSYRIYNFEERRAGYMKALRDSGMPASDAIIHMLPPSMEGAYKEMLHVLDSSDAIAPCYFADNDLIAAGAIKAFKRKGLSIPEDVGIIGFDNIPLCTYLEPTLTSIHVPVQAMCSLAVRQLNDAITGAHSPAPLRIEVSTNLVRRNSV